MSQYTAGTITANNGSQAITGINTQWLTEVLPGNLFAIPGQSVVYHIASVDSDTQLTLSANYTGPALTASGYIIARDFTPNSNLPLLNQGDNAVNELHNRAMAKIDQNLQLVITSSTFLFKGDWLSSTAYSLNDLVGADDGDVYRAMISHTSSGDFNADKDAGRWKLYIDNSSVLRAQEWAENPEDDEVLSGAYSALHHARKAEDFASSASGSASAAATSESNAASSVQAASDSASAAATSEVNAATSESNAANSETNASLSETDAATAAQVASSAASVVGGLALALGRSTIEEDRKEALRTQYAATLASRAVAPTAADFPFDGGEIPENRLSDFDFMPEKVLDDAISSEIIDGGEIV